MAISGIDGGGGVAARGRARNPDKVTTAAPGLPLQIVVLFLSMLVPFIIQVGDLRMSVYRAVLIVTVLPNFFAWTSGRAGPVRLADFAVLFVWFWSSLAFIVLHGMGQAIQPDGMLFVETAGAWFMARVHIRDAETFRRTVRMLFLIIFLLIPTSLFETITGHNIILETANSVMPSYDLVYKEPRWGLTRVQGPFEHQILFGVFCGSAVALNWYVLGQGRGFLGRLWRTLLILCTAALALSSGPLTALVAQVMLITWDVVMRSVKSRWVILTVSVAILWTAIEIAANRSAAEIFINVFAFDQETAWNRINIWHFGTISIMNYPLFGVGMNEWARPWWMSASMDMFWIVSAVTFGLPAGIAQAVAFLSAFLSVAFRKGLSPLQSDYRTGYLICMMGFLLAGWTVHYWNATYVLYYFLLGSGMWLLDAKPDTGADAEAKPDPVRARRRAAMAKQ